MQVDFFANCKPDVIIAIVNILIPVIYLPGDYIMLHGEIGREVKDSFDSQIKIIAL